MTLTAPDRSHVPVVHALYAQLTAPPGWKIEIINGDIVVSPSHSPAKAYVVERIRSALASRLPSRFGIYENVGIGESRTEMYVPDLSVWPREALLEATFPPDPTLCALTVEVTALDKWTPRTTAVAYARRGVPVHLVANWSSREYEVFSQLHGDTYRSERQVAFEKPLALPLDPPIDLEVAYY